MVAHAHGPEDRTQIELDMLLPQSQCAVKLIPGHSHMQLPSFVEIDAPVTTTKVEVELVSWGHNCKVLQCGHSDKFLCLQFQEDGHHYILCNEDINDTQGCILHSQDKPLDTVGLMKLLGALGYDRAVVLEAEDVGMGHTHVLFCNNNPQFEKTAQPPRTRTEWPHWPCTTQPIGKLFPKQSYRISDAQHSNETAFRYHDILELMEAGKSFLNTTFDGLELPDFIQDAVCKTRSMTTYDRWLIYTDGSSQSKLRRVSPVQVDEMGHPDSWAMLVLGEIQTADGTSIIEPIGWCAHPVHYDPSGSCFTHATRIGAEVAEREAIIWAGLWRLTQDTNIPTIFCCDSMTCGNQAFGIMGVGDADDSYRLMRGIFQSLERGLPEGHLRLHHVRSHAGDPYNEFVDWAAKQEAVKSFNHRQMQLDMRKWCQILPHFWLVFGLDCGLPDWQDGQLVTMRPSLPAARSATSSASPGTSIAVVQCALSLATANVLSLSKGPDGHGGKLHYLFEQMKSFGLNVMGLQECRTDEGHTKTHNILRYMSGQRHGQDGIEIWINLEQPIAYNARGKPFFLAAHHCQVVQKDPSRLLLRVSAPFFTGWFFAAHAPHSGRTREDREEWWTETTAILDRTGATSNCFWLLDANAEPGPAEDSIIFSTGLRTSANTILFRECLRKFNMCLPSTSSVHRGSRDTWMRPGGDTTYCIDYVAVPQAWKSHCTWSEVLQDFDLATMRQDHQAVGLELRWWHQCEEGPQPDSMPTVAWHLDTTKKLIREKMQQVSIPTWETDVETQEKDFSLQVANLLRQQRHSKHRPKKCYIDDEIWEARRQMLSSQKKLKQVRQRLGRESLWHVFIAWKQQREPPDQHELFQYGTTLRCDALRLLAQLRAQRQRLRCKLKQTKAKHMQKCLEQVNEHTAASSILRILKCFIGPTNPKKQKKGTLPMLEREDGEICSTPEEALQVWIRFFADMEGGKRQSIEELHADWVRDLSVEQAIPFKLQVADLPTLADLELAYRRVASGKATGPDRVPGELCHIAPAACARATYSSLWKLLLFGHEALQYKGGLLVQAYKGKGAVTKCSSYRSLLISSHIGKSLHRAMRCSQAHIFEGFLQAQQLGGRRAMPVTYGVHLVRAFHRQAQHCGHSCALIMLDLKEAFYRIFRPICMEGTVTDQAIAQLMQRLKMPAEALADLHRLLRDPCALEQAGMTPQQRRGIRAVHSQTFFWMHRQHDIVQTSHGSRPGDPFADVIFSYVWAVVLRKLQTFMQNQGIISEFRQRPTLMLFDNEHPVAAVYEPFIGPTWMDDLCVCVEGCNPAQTIQRATLATGRLLELCMEHCMTPNLQPNKTEILFSLRGEASRKYKKELYGPQASGSIPIVCEYGTFQVPVASRYCHLGGILHHVAEQQVEIKRRLAIANAAMTKHSKQVFRNWAIPLKKRTQIFEALILSKLLYGADTWVVTDDKAEKYFHAATIRLYRRLLPVSHDHHLHDLEVLAQVKLPSPFELLRRARLRYVATLLHSGPRQEWGLLEQDKQWSLLVEEDMAWLWKQIHNCSNLGNPADQWPSWKSLILHHRTYWRKLVRRGL